MDLSTGFLGAGTIRELQERTTAKLLTIGSDSFTRRDFAKVDCFNFLAAQNLSYYLNKTLKVANTRHVYFNVNPGELAIPHLGVFSLAVLGAAFEVKRLGTLEQWLKQHKVEIVTFHTLKLHELEDGRQERKDRRERQHARRNTAHGLRLARFEKRSGTHG